MLLGLLFTVWSMIPCFNKECLAISAPQPLKKISRFFGCFGHVLQDFRLSEGNSNGWGFSNTVFLK